MALLIFDTIRIDNFQISGIGWHARIGPCVICTIGEVHIWEEARVFNWTNITLWGGCLLSPQLLVLGTFSKFAAGQVLSTEWLFPIKDTGYRYKSRFDRYQHSDWLQCGVFKIVGLGEIESGSWNCNTLFYVKWFRFRLFQQIWVPSIALKACSSRSQLKTSH